MKYLKLFISIFLLTLLINVSVSYASTMPDFDDYIKNDDGTEKYYHVTLCNSHNDDFSDDYYELIIVKFIPHNIVYYNSAGFVYSPSYSNYSDQYMSIYQYKPSVDSDWVHVVSGNNVRNIEYGFSADTYVEGSYDIITVYSNYDIILTAEQSTFFQRPRSLAMVLQTIPMTMRTGILSQVGFLIPCLISCVIGLIAFRKCWNWLKVQLLV